MMTATEFQKEYQRLCMPLGMYALRIVGEVSDAEDIVQAAFMAAWQKVGEGAEIDNLKAYMYGSVRNAALSHMDRKGRRREVPLELCGEVTEEDIDTSERDAALWRAIDSLPERCRRAFLMSKRDGMSHAEIAAEMGVTVKTVENQIAKAFSRLRGDSRLLGGGAVVFLPFL